MKLGNSILTKIQIGLRVPAIFLFLLIISCSEESVNKRGLAAKRGSSPAVSAGGGDLQGASTPTINVSGVTLTTAKNNDALTSEFKANIILVNKVSATQIVLFGKDGRSWLYNPAADAAPALLEPPIVQPLGSNVYTLPEGNFWLIGAQTIGRRKAVDAAGGAVTVESFNTSTIQGDWAKARVLYAATDTLILHLDSHIAIIAIRNGAPALSQFSSKLPVALDSQIVAAGETEAGGFWFAAKSTAAVLEPTGLTLAWSRAKLPLAGHEDYSQLAMRLDSKGKSVTGDVMLFQADKFWSITGAAVQ